ncbi:bifunctional metallophosphatase/5'-nucleotidase [Falsiroseomonas selenitidurans]|uniref:Bifunctional metallophosphatase/5'-nucleotidase n=1 Tax=Falsiroseomonas selenitidurans TaxID=2716335 RepID=A0ABX1E628_9PROT|nr:5'-nucleotidase C-terminal domain-containing protein [Falsiroseomonas selenitidurans]NKC32627.1 bifunctional metallophosphatase/5'-nucleotidase [Falsiroseomonas selenitidurans]
MILRRRTLLTALPLAAPTLRRAAAATTARVSLLHLNDFHSRHEGAQASGAACRTGAPCAGGAARLVAAFHAARAAATAEGRPVLALDAGDQFLGSLFYTRHRGLAEAAVQRQWGVQAMAPGNHDFNGGPETLAAYLRALGVPLLAANLDASAEPALAGLVAPAAVFSLGGARLGVVGVTLETIPEISSPGPRLRFTAPEEPVARAIAGLRAEAPTTIVVLSHLGLAADQALAAAVPGIDVIVGGHSHTLVTPPLVVDGADRPARIVQAGALGRWRGRLDLDLAADGRVAAHAGGAAEITPDMPEDPATARIVAEYGAPLAGLRARPVAQSAGGLENTICRLGECAVGNLLADALLAAVPGADLALTNAGGIRTGLPTGAITLGDVLTTLPFSNTVATVRLRGAALLAALENGVSAPGSGRFPQVAGLAFTWNPAAPAGQRIATARITTGRQAGPVRPEADYLMVTNNFLRAGGDGYAVLRDQALEAYDAGPPMEDAFAAYLTARGTVAPVIEGRIAAR